MRNLEKTDIRGTTIMTSAGIFTPFVMLVNMAETKIFYSFFSCKKCR